MTGSSEIEVYPNNAAVVPTTGEILDLGDVREVARVRRELKEIRANVDAFNQMLDAVILDESARQGTKTLRLGRYEVTIGPDSEPEWDVDVLAELRDAGLPEARYDALVRTEVSYKVDGRVAAQIAKANPEYAAIVERAQSRKPKRPSVRIDEA
jgi:hypothetical protein